MIKDAVDQAAKLNRVHFYIKLITYSIYAHTVYSVYKMVFLEQMIISNFLSIE